MQWLHGLRKYYYKSDNYHDILTTYMSCFITAWYYASYVFTTVNIYLFSYGNFARFFII